MARIEAPMMVGLRPHLSAVSAPMPEPIGAPSDITSAYPNDFAMLNPWCTKKVGNQVTKPYNKVLITTSVTHPTIMRGNIAPVKSEPSARDGATEGLGDGVGNVPPCSAFTSLSIFERIASAS